MTLAELKQRRLLFGALLQALLLLGAGGISLLLDRLYFSWKVVIGDPIGWWIEVWVLVTLTATVCVPVLARTFRIELTRWIPRQQLFYLLLTMAVVWGGGLGFFVHTTVLFSMGGWPDPAEIALFFLVPLAGGGLCLAMISPSQKVREPWLRVAGCLCVAAVSFQLLPILLLAVLGEQYLRFGAYYKSPLVAVYVFGGGLMGAVIAHIACRLVGRFQGVQSGDAVAPAS